MMSRHSFFEPVSKRPQGSDDGSLRRRNHARAMVKAPAELFDIMGVLAAGIALVTALSGLLTH
jgi:hypothetical protein